MRILVMNGPNLGLLGMREPGVYGAETLETIIERVRRRGAELGVESVDAFQSDIEGDLVRHIGACRGRYAGVMFNPGAFTHTSVALRDAIQASDAPFIEVHLSNVAAREGFRHTSLTASACIGQIMGLGPHGYVLALEALVERTRAAKS